MQATQAQILKHHGGDAEHARQMITQSYARRHDAAFWDFWDTKMAPVIEPGKVLMDVGAGIGQFVNDLALRYPHNTALGIDAAQYMLAAQLELPANGRFLKDDLNQPSAAIEPGSVAVVMANMLVHELPQPVNLFKAVFAWLKPGGRFCVIDLVRQPLQQYLEHKYCPAQIWQEPMPRAQLEEVFEHFLEHNRYHADDLIYLLTQAGFVVLENTPQNSGRMVRIVVEKPL